MRVSSLAFAVLLAASSVAVGGQWPDYGGTPDQSKFAVTPDITKRNVSQLDVAWTYPTSDERAYQFNPVIVDNVMYVLAKNSSLVAIDVVTRKELWIHANLRGITSRGINYWKSKDGKERRLLFALEDTLQAIDARTGKSVLTFGKNGVVDLKEGLDRDPLTIRRVMSGTPGRIFEDLILLGSSPGEGYFSAPGHIRAYNVITGALAWTFHTIPKPGEFGYDTWPKDAWKYMGGVNVWGEITLDEKRGIAYFPVSSPTYDYYGADRHGANLFSDCLLALDARTGKRLWHYQMVHHDLWDYDPTAAPQLISVWKGGKRIDAVAQATKQGFVFVFDRVTGEPVWPIEERKVPPSDVPGEAAWPTQPYSTLPPSARQVVTPEDLTPYLISDAERAVWRERIGKARTGLFNPPALVESAVVPGAVGGTNWGNTAANPEAGMLYLLNQDFPSFYKLQEQMDRNVAGGRGRYAPPDPAAVQRGAAVYKESCAMCHGQDRSGTPAGPSLVTIGAQIAMTQLRRIVLFGNGRMPPIGHLEEEQIKDILAFLGGGGTRRPNDVPATMPEGPVVAAGGAPRAPAPQSIEGMQNYPKGLSAPAVRYYTDYGLGYPYLMGPPWSQIMAYDLNRGTIKWTKPLGQDLDVTKAGGQNTGIPRGSQRQGMIVTSTGIVFSTARDGVLYAFDADDGDVLWSYKLPMATEGLPSIYEVEGRHYIVVNATTPHTWGLNSQLSGIGSPEPLGKGGYVVFAIKPPVGDVPLPDGFKAAAASAVPGVYARAVQYENQFELQDALAAASKACIARGRNLEHSGDFRQGSQIMWWLYRSGTEAAVFRRDIHVKVDADNCRISVEEKREVKRSTLKAGELPSPFSARPLKCSGLAKKCYSTEMFGVKARCRAEGNGFQLTRDCVSVDRGPSRGMLLESVYESDDMTGSGFAVGDLKTDASIDASIFDHSRTW
jgi:glucose dehydrogenase